MKTRLRDWLNTHKAATATSLVLWLCAALLILLFTVPFFGWETGISALAIALIAAILIYWRICLFPTSLSEENSNVKRSRVR